MIPSAKIPARKDLASRPDRKRVLVVDDHAVVRTGLATLINEENDLIICGEAENENMALEAARQLQPDIAVVDWSLKNNDASGMVAALRRNHPQLPVLVLSIHDETLYADRAIRAGACGYVMKQEAANKIVEAIRRVATGQSYLSERAAHAMAVAENYWSESEESTSLTTVLSQRPAPAGNGHGTTVALKKNSGLKISIIIPVYNSEETIELLCDLLVEELAKSFSLQIVLVEDGSADFSVAACRRLHQKYPEIVDCLILARNFGEYNAVMAGLHAAEGDYCVIMDDDFQNPPAEVRHLIDEIRKGYDVVYTRYASMQHSWFRRLGSRLHNWTATHALGKPPDLYLSSFKIISRFLVQEIIQYPGPDPYLDAIILRTTRRIGTLTVRHEPRKQGKSGYTLRKLVSLWGNIIVAFSLQPLRLLFVLGTIMTMLGGAKALALLIGGPSPEGDTSATDSLAASIWFCAGIMLISAGLVGEYVGRIHKHLSRAPQFIVRTVLKRHARN